MNILDITKLNTDYRYLFTNQTSSNYFKLLKSCRKNTMRMKAMSLEAPAGGSTNNLFRLSFIPRFPSQQSCDGQNAWFSSRHPRDDQE